MQVGIIGFGRLGGLITKYLSQDATVLVFDKKDLKKEIEAVGAKAVTLEEICDCPIIIPFVPISEFENVIKEISPIINKDALVIDICSVKEHPVEIMEKHLPSTVQILGTHPMFGPDSAKQTVMGTKIVLCKVRMENELYNNVKSYLEGHGIKTIEATPAEHDEQISHSLLLTHFIGRSLMDLGTTPLDIDTKGYRRLMKILQTVENDSWQLFEDMNKYNKYSSETRADFMKSLNTINDRIKE